ncbi:ASCH domain-containing protein [Saccharopolyspora rhizosphaerae]|uniref:ASCH domain-containing protein n=1 Tax=Saccharopolyspora rhizosphaerae TaxID=2492662 RepID=A0A3R8QTM5_9PSEU|nr:ASCH domain-containing protein [Saccharopolyspora rhizosphaerae]RRO19269.1 ASCH domain-containing protein [Saccharopolyspora rhizosphaerae]
MLSRDDRALVEAAATQAEAVNDGGDHTVAAAMRLGSGALVFGVNAHHFLGGPCAEINALANRAAVRPNDPVVAVAASYGPTGDVIAPCGKCRQVLFDVDPAIRCVVREPNGLTAVPVTELLPHAFDSRALEGPQRLHMGEGYEQSILDGHKRQTIRVDDPFRPGDAVLVFAEESGEVRTMPCTILSVRTATRDELTLEDARRDGFEDLAELHAALDQHYPGLQPTDPVDIVEFALPIAGAHPA